MTQTHRHTGQRHGVLLRTFTICFVAMCHFRGAATFAEITIFEFMLFLSCSCSCCRNCCCCLWAKTKCECFVDHTYIYTRIYNRKTIMKKREHSLSSTHHSLVSDRVLHNSIFYSHRLFESHTKKFVRYPFQHCRCASCSRYTYIYIW